MGKTLGIGSFGKVRPASEAMTSFVVMTIMSELTSMYGGFF